MLLQATFIFGYKFKDIGKAYKCPNYKLTEDKDGQTETITQASWPVEIAYIIDHNEIDNKMVQPKIAPESIIQSYVLPPNLNET